MQVFGNVHQEPKTQGDKGSDPKGVFLDLWHTARGSDPVSPCVFVVPVVLRIALGSLRRDDILLHFDFSGVATGDAAHFSQRQYSCR